MSAPERQRYYAHGDESETEPGLYYCSVLLEFLRPEQFRLDVGPDHMGIRTQSVKDFPSRKFRRPFKPRTVWQLSYVERQEGLARPEVRYVHGDRYLHNANMCFCAICDSFDLAEHILGAHRKRDHWQKRSKCIGEFNGCNEFRLEREKIAHARIRTIPQSLADLFGQAK